jgi:hypothetical protein
MAQTKAVAKVEKAGALERPAFIKPGDARGAQGIKSEDVQMARLGLAQSLSPELDPSSPKYVEGLKLGDAFNSLTGEVYGKEPLEVVIVRCDGSRFIEFNPREAGGGIKDYAVPAGDPRTEFTTDAKTGASIKPLATKFLEFVAILPKYQEPIALSFKGSGLKTAKTLNGLIRMASARLGTVPSFSFRFFLTPSIETNSKGKYAVFSVKPAGTVDEETFTFASAFYDTIKDRAVVVDVEAEGEAKPDEDVPF